MGATSTVIAFGATLGFVVLWVCLLVYAGQIPAMRN